MMRFIKNLFLENWNLKTTALLLALILWLFVRGEPGAITVVDVPLEIQVPPSMEITNERPATIEVTMRGTALSKTWFGRQRWSTLCASHFPPASSICREPRKENM